jgi:hypothetical protein
MIFLKLKDEKVQAAEARAGLRSFQTTMIVLLLLLALVAFTGSNVISDPLVLLSIPFVIGSWSNIFILEREGVQDRYKAEFRKDPAFRKKGILVYSGTSVAVAVVWLAMLRLQIIDGSIRTWGYDILYTLIFGIGYFSVLYFSMFRRGKKTQDSITPTNS